jgi:type 1 fimbriae regulatory protein FimB/type 1 fimbriae regulatory protein FimE
MKAMAGNRNAHRDATMVLVAFSHGLRVSELVDLRWDQIDFNAATLHVRRAKKGTPASHPVRGDEPCDVCSASRSRNRRSFSPRSAAHRSRPRALLA